MTDACVLDGVEALLRRATTCASWDFVGASIPIPLLRIDCEVCLPPVGQYS